MRLLLIIPGIQFALALAIIYFCQVSLNPQIREARLRLIKILSQKDPALMDKMQDFVLFRLSDYLGMPLEFLFNWWFIAIPLILLLAKLFGVWYRNLQNRQPAFLVIYLGSAIFLLLAIFNLALSAVNASILLPNCLKWGG